MSARILNTTGKRIAFHRDELGFSQEGLAAELRRRGIDIKRSQVSRIENQDHPPSGEILSALAHILGLTTDYLLVLSDTPLPPEGAPHAFKDEGVPYEVEDSLVRSLVDAVGRLSRSDQAMLLGIAERLASASQPRIIGGEEHA